MAEAVKALDTLISPYMGKGGPAAGPTQDILEDLPVDPMGLPTGLDAPEHPPFLDQVKELSEPHTSPLTLAPAPASPTPSPPVDADVASAEASEQESIPTPSTSISRWVTALEQDVRRYALREPPTALEEGDPTPMNIPEDMDRGPDQPKQPDQKNRSSADTAHTQKDVQGKERAHSSPFDEFGEDVHITLRTTKDTETSTKESEGKGSEKSLDKSTDQPLSQARDKGETRGRAPAHSTSHHSPHRVSPDTHMQLHHLQSQPMHSQEGLLNSSQVMGPTSSMTDAQTQQAQDQGEAKIPAPKTSQGTAEVEVQAENSLDSTTPQGQEKAPPTRSLGATSLSDHRAQQDNRPIQTMNAENLSTKKEGTTLSSNDGAQQGLGDTSSHDHTPTQSHTHALSASQQNGASSTGTHPSASQLQPWSYVNSFGQGVSHQVPLFVVVPSATSGTQTFIREENTTRRGLKQLSAQISVARGFGFNRFQIKLEEPDLGPIEVTLNIGKGGRMKAHFIAEQDDTLEVLRDEADHLAQSMGEENLFLDPQDSKSLSFEKRT